MSTISPTVTIPVRRMQRLATGYVVQQLNMGDWAKVSKVYSHSTSAFAALGRLVQKDTTLLVDQGRTN